MVTVALWAGEIEPLMVMLCPRVMEDCDTLLLIELDCFVLGVTVIEQPEYVCCVVPLVPTMTKLKVPV